MSLMISLLAIFSGCGTSRKEWVDTNCNEAGGNAQGQKDARVGRGLHTIFLEKCPQDTIEVTRKGYLEGFKEAGGQEFDDSHVYGEDLLQDAMQTLETKPAKKKTAEKSSESPAPK